MVSDDSVDAGLSPQFVMTLQNLVDCDGNPVIVVERRCHIDELLTVQQAPRVLEGIDGEVGRIGEPLDIFESLLMGPQFEGVNEASLRRGLRSPNRISHEGSLTVSQLRRNGHRASGDRDMVDTTAVNGLTVIGDVSMNW